MKRGCQYLVQIAWGEGVTLQRLLTTSVAVNPITSVDAVFALDRGVVAKYDAIAIV